MFAFLRRPGVKKEAPLVQRALVVEPVEKTPDLGYSLLPPPQSLEGEIR